MSNRLNNEFFGHLFSKLNGMKKQAVELKKKAFLESGKVQQPPCSLCGRWFGSAEQKFIIIPNFKPEPHCPSCKKALADGYTAFVSTDGRFSFNKFPNATEAERAAIAGKVISVTNERMEIIQCKCMWLDDALPPNRCTENANWESVTPHSEGGSVTYRFCSKHRDEVLKEAEKIEDEKQRRKMVESFKAIVTLGAEPPTTQVEYEK